MGHIKEPVGIDFVVDPTPLSIQDRKSISEIITYYKETGRKMPKERMKSQMIGKYSTASISIIQK
jgi:hypothetical protein